jgi:hypothetical protein
LTSATIPRSDAAQNINLTFWSWLRLLLWVSRSFVNLHFLQPFQLHAKHELLFTFCK